MSSESLDVEEFIVGYLAEVDDHLSVARGCLVALDASLQKHEPNPKAVRELFRSLHTIKGLSAMVGAEPIVDISHELETLLRAADRSGSQLNTRAIDQIVQGLRAIEERTGNLARREPLAPAPPELLSSLAALELTAQPEERLGPLSLAPELLEKLTATEQAQLARALTTGRRALRVDFVPTQERAARGLNITSVRTRLSALGELVKVIPRVLGPKEAQGGGIAFVVLLVTDATDEAIAELTDARPQPLHAVEAPEPKLPTVDEVERGELEQGQQQRNVIRVDARRLDDALEMLSSLMVTRARLQRTLSSLEQGPHTRQLAPILAENSRQLRDLRAAIMRARMVPVAEILERTPLLVRGLSRSSHKQVHLEIDAGRSELDKSVADKLSPAIVHLVRNAVDHAIELPDVRLARGKPAEGRVRISCEATSTSHLELRVSDDGAGIDPVKVAERAGRPVPESDAELLALITRPGLSTLDQATRTSGRGLGMDIVKRIVVDELGGQLQLHTRLGEGTRFTLTVPLTVTILDAFTLVTAERTYVVPVSAVEDLVELEPQAVSAGPNPDAATPVRLLRHRGATLPLFRLSALLGVEAAARPHPKAIIVRRDHQGFAFEVDKLVGQQEVVVRPLSDALVKVRGVSGATDLGDGQPTLVLDLLGLLEHEALELS